MLLSDKLVRLGGQLGTFLAGNALVQGLNMVTGLVILWSLPVDQYALYITSSALIAMGSVGSDAGISQALLTLGSRALGDRPRVSAIFVTCWTMRRQAMGLLSLLVFVAAAVIGYGQQWSAMTGLLVVGMVLATNWAQLRISPYTSLFNIYQDSRSIFVSTLFPSLLRLGLSLWLCRIWPLAAVALLVNILGFIVQDRVATRMAHGYVDQASEPSSVIRHDVVQFIVPLMPGILYFIFQGQIAVFMLTWAGDTSAIAEVGALGRLQQVFVLLGALNSFFIQPYFARITDRRIFRTRLWMVLAAATAFSAVVMASAYVLDSWWILILGANYAHLKDLIPLTVAGCLVTIFSSTLYFTVIATQFTRYQWLQIPLGLGAQLAVMAGVGVQSTRDALLVTYAPACSYGLLQLVLAHVAMRHIRPAETRQIQT